ncbi:hypothetical protein [Streptomyces sp. NPDC094049]|uniref:hypothetical protein n=1 Tax=Streptomyces sp. NPDC094049 TaxID=3154987 RepID=UPI003324BA94
MKTRETASTGFRHVFALHHEAWIPFQQDPALDTAVIRQEQVRLDLGTRMFSGTEDDQADEKPTSPEEIRARQRQANDAVRVTAILRARAERAERTVRPAAPILRQAG